ncbi:MAG: serine--tRNA ligase [Candidatus Saccharimonadales bacterium]
MLDIRYIRQNPELVAEKSKQKGYPVDILKLLELDEQRRQLLAEVEDLRAKRNELASELKSKKPGPDKIEQGRKLRDQLDKVAKRLAPIDEQYLVRLKAVPNMPETDVPVGTSEDDNKVAKQWGDKPKFDFKPKNHWEIAEARGWIDKERAAKVAGSRFAYIKGDLARLQFALIQWAIEKLTDEKIIKKILSESGVAASSKPFIPIVPPAMIHTDVYEAMDRLEPSDDRYKVGTDDDNLWLQGSAEHTLGPMYMKEILKSEDLPIRYLGYATSFRREAGSYGKDAEGIFRMHQFDKLEMESFTGPNDGRNEHLFLIAIQEHLMRQLKLPYQVLLKCTADIGKPNARGVDLEAWLPGQSAYRETHTADYMTDYQTRRLGTKVKSGAEEVVFAHTNDATAIALGRTMIAIIENYQNKDGSVNLPTVLQPYMSGKTKI